MTNARPLSRAALLFAGAVGVGACSSSSSPSFTFQPVGAYGTTTFIGDAGDGIDYDGGAIPDGPVDQGKAIVIIPDDASFADGPVVEDATVADAGPSRDATSEDAEPGFDGHVGKDAGVPFDGGSAADATMSSDGASDAIVTSDAGPPVADTSPLADAADAG